MDDRWFRLGDHGRYSAFANGIQMTILACLAMMLLLQDPPAIIDVNDPNALSAETLKSIKAGTKIFMAGASKTVCHPLYLGEKPKLPIRDKNNGIHPASCNPSFTFSVNRINKPELTALIPHFKNLLPSGHASHVGIYLPKNIFGDKTFITELQKQLPNCKIYEHSREAVLREINKPPLGS